MRKGRRAEELRPVTITPAVAKFAAGSARIELGDTHVFCTASLGEGVPGWLRGSGRGWLTAEYSMLPGATPTRGAREAVRGRQSGRTMEIQRLIGRSLRSVVDLGIIGERTIAVDCDVLQADGGTRTASITGAYVAVYQVALKIKDLLGLNELPLFDSVAAASAGVVDGEARLDLDYEEDSAAEVDLNAVVTGDGRLVEVQSTAEGEPFSRAALDGLLDLVVAGAATLRSVQAAACAELERA
ncbi:MAG TPA: ribonuclease PH [Thermoleophilia bacterium]|nr:ribonuclease PH [Thermoleophilia bacterium]